jgi:hypothetical protein
LSSDASFDSFFANRRGACHLPVQIQTGEQFSALADSGAELSLINRQLTQQLHLDIFRANDKVSWTDINKKKSTQDEYVFLSLRLKNKAVPFRRLLFVVVADLPEKIVLDCAHMCDLGLITVNDDCPKRIQQHTSQSEQAYDMPDVPGLEKD